jgi:hypothetical protein
MEDICFSIYQDNTLQKTTLQDLLKNKQVLFCSATRAGQALFSKYAVYLKELQEKCNIEIVVVAASSNLITLAYLTKNFPFIKSVYDTEFQFTKWMSEQYNQSRPVDVLAKFWNYQILFSDGKPDKFYQSPTTNHVRNLINAGHSNTLKKYKDYVTVPNEQAFYCLTLQQHEKNYEHGGYVFYQNIWPNSDLEEYLLDKVE